MLHQKLLKVVAAEPMKMAVHNRGGAAGSLASIEHRQLAKKSAGFQLGQRDFLKIFVCYPNSHGAFFQNVQCVTAVVFMEDRLAGLIVDLVNLFRKMLKLVRFQPLE